MCLHLTQECTLTDLGWCCQARHEDEVGILLVHGFGAGAFAWRHIMQPLADAAGCRVLAFDRPAFGESHWTSKHTYA